MRRVLGLLLIWPLLASAQADSPQLAELDSDYYRAPPSIRLQYTAQYLLLAGFLAIMAYEVHETMGARQFH